MSRTIAPIPSVVVTVGTSTFFLETLMPSRDVLSIVQVSNYSCRTLSWKHDSLVTRPV